ncbi:glycoside hydrolase family 13 protein [Mycolicibacter terrae]|uniref:Glycoside hydrolase family 13 protein n=1 Tax=Mycolicibacter terrae TaxID=1788 RepID=A0ACD2ES50_9MYCO|nr:MULTISPECIES: glycoside hydrolase family 13 protein [Mycolicibacter]OBH19241.1 alpha-amylase [Mycolicibacter sinensis]RRR47875.1 glycoside hydrolase family 13 protein [Mycolicibacter terrae]
MGAGNPWWANSVFYQAYPRSFADSNGDGVGDLDGVIARLDYLRGLGVDAIWLNPVTVSPMADHGYDVADPRDIDPLFGDLAALDRLVAAAHERGIKLTMDLVPNHTSAAHPWFVEALASAPGGSASLDEGEAKLGPPHRPGGSASLDEGEAKLGPPHRPGSRARARYFFRDGRGPAGERPPNNWVSVFGGPAWTRVTEPDGPGQWYLHLFDTSQPDLNWDNPEVLADFEQTLRFWLDRGVDGFRIDVSHGMAKPPGLPDMPVTDVELLAHRDDDPRFNQPGVHRIHRAIRAVFDDYPDAVSVGEVWVHDNALFAEYLRPDELHLAFNFRLLQADFDAAGIRDAIENSLAAVASVGGTPTWALENHDVQRSVTRYGGGAAGLARARAMALVLLALPGAVFVYNGQELGLPEVELPDGALQDPVWERSGHTKRGRDGCRVPVPWSGDAPPFGFSDNPDTWLPMPRDWAPLTVERQRGDAGSALTLYQQAIALRREHVGFGSRVEWLPAPADVVMFRCGGLVCALNAGDQPVARPEGQLILASAPAADGVLPANAAAWLI